MGSLDIQYQRITEEKVLAAVKSPLPQLGRPSASLSVTATSTKDVISGGLVKLNERVWTTYSTLWSCLPHSESRLGGRISDPAQSGGLIGGVYRLDWAQVSPMRHQPGPELPGALAKWEGNTIKCQGQLNYKCIRSSLSVASLFAAKGF